MRSMTGFGRGAALAGAWQVAVEAAGVNRRNLEVTASLPREWSGAERLVAERVRAHAARGKVHVTVTLSRATGPAAPAEWAFDTEAAGRFLDRLGEFARAQGVAFIPDQATMLAAASAHRVTPELPPLADAEEALATALEDALAAFRATREAEGAALAADLAARAARLAQWTGEIEALAQGAVPAYRDALLARLRQLNLDLDPGDERVLKELAFFADKADVAEEITRLRSHLAQFAAELGAAEPVGRKLEFLLQELLREFNTVGSKTTLLEVTKRVLEAKNELERLREQVQNVE